MAQHIPSTKLPCIVFHEDDTQTGLRVSALKFAALLLMSFFFKFTFCDFCELSSRAQNAHIVCV